MVTGSTPFEGESPYVVMNARVTGDPEAPRKLNPELNPALEEVILHALERDPRAAVPDRGRDEAELDNLDKVEITHRDQRLRAPQPWKSKSLVPLLIGSIIVLLLALFFVIFLLASHRGR